MCAGLRLRACDRHLYLHDDMQELPDLIAIGIDVGETRTREAAVDGADCILARRQRATEQMSAGGELSSGLTV